jgi:hypothetical protein
MSAKSATTLAAKTVNAATLGAYPTASALIGAGFALLAYGARKAASDATSDTATIYEAWKARADEARHLAADRLSAAYARSRDEVSSLADSAVERGGQISALAQEQAGIAADLANDLSAAFRDGLEGLSEEAANRIVVAREAAYSTLSKGRDNAQSGLRSGRDLVRRHPYAAAAIGLAIGAGIAAALPRGRQGADTNAKVKALSNNAKTAAASAKVSANRVAKTAKAKAAAVGDDVAEAATTASKAVTKAATPRKRSPRAAAKTLQANGLLPN